MFYFKYILSYILFYQDNTIYYKEWFSIPGNFMQSCRPALVCETYS